jgi:hypothetical protein
MTEWGQSHSQKFAWTRVFRPMVQGHPLTPFSRLAFAGDITSSLTHWGTGGLRYINADYTVTASRLPDGEYLGLAAQSHYATAGVNTSIASTQQRPSRRVPSTIPGRPCLACPKPPRSLRLSSNPARS